MLENEVKDQIRDAYQRVAEHIPNFKRRGSQRKMIADVANGLANVTDADEFPDGYKGPITVIEAPTGTGKTYAYLLAAIAVAKAKNKKVILSTATVALQTQLMEKDLPTLHKASGYDFTFTLAKGRGRYACSSKLAQIDSSDGQQVGFFQNKPTTKDLKQLKALKTALFKNEWTGDLDDWDDRIDDTLWREITNDKFGCAKQHCEHFNGCPFFKARAAVHAVDLIVVNHDLVLADLTLGGGVLLPPPGQCIYLFDEAHHLGDKALRHFQHAMSTQSTLTYINSHATSLCNLLSALPAPTIQQQAGESETLLLELGGELESFLNTLRMQPEIAKISTDDYRWRFENGEVPEWLRDSMKAMNQIAEKLYKSLEKIQKGIDDLARRDMISQTTVEQTQATLGPMTHRIEQLSALTSSYAAIGGDKNIPYARWINISKTTQKIEYTLNSSPVWAAGILQHALWGKCAGAILTSATLTALGRFDDIYYRFGLTNREQVHCSIMPSPFNLKEMATLHIPKMSALPNQAEAHTKEIIKLLPDLCKGSHSALVLFCSRRQMQDVFDALPKSLSNNIKMQGQFSKRQLINMHMLDIDNGSTSIIFGLASFSEGVDLKGKYCEHVIIAKLDFSVPDDPILKTLEEWLTQQGRSAFFDVSLPHCSRKLVQACGRLIRTEEDRGRITLLDRRVITKNYGKMLLDGLPGYLVEIER